MLFGGALFSSNDHTYESLLTGLFEESCYGDGKGKKPRLQVTIPRLQLSQEQLERLRKNASKHQKVPLIASKEDEKEHCATVNANAASSASTTETITAATITAVTTTVVKEPVTTVEESPVRHRLSNLLDGSTLSSYWDSAVHVDEEEDNLKSINCKGADQFNNAESLSAPVSAVTEDNLFCSEELLSSDNGWSPLMHEEDCITVPCYPDVVSKTCMQVEIGCTQTSSDNNSQAVEVITASMQDKEEDYETNQRLQPASVDEMSNFPEEGTEPGSTAPGSCDLALGQVSNNAGPGEKEAENGNAEEGSGLMLRSAEVEDNMIDYASHYNTLEAMNTLLTKFTEEKRARTELEELVSHLEENNKELVSECEKLRDLVDDLLPSSKVKNETVSRGVQVNMDLSLRRGRAVDRATSPLKRIREPSPDLTLQSFSTGCQTVNLSNEMKSTACQTDPPVDARLLARCTTQSTVPARVQGIVMPNVQGRAPVQVPNYTQASNPVQTSYSQTPPSFQQQSAIVAVSQQLGMQSQQGQALRQMLAKQQYPTNVLQTAGYNNVAGPHAATLNSPQVRITQPTGAALYAQAPPNHLTPMPSLITQISGNQTLVGSNPTAYTGVYDTAIQRNAINYNTLSAQQAPRPDTSNQTTGQRLNLNTATLSQLVTQNQLLAHNNASVSNQTLSSAQSTSYNSRSAQFVGAQQHSAQQQTIPTSSLQVSANARSAIRGVMLHLTNGTRHQITTTAAQSLRNPQQPLGASLPSRMAYNQVTTPQHKEGLPLQHQVLLPKRSQAQQHTSLQNSQQSLGTFPQSRVGYNQVAVPQQTGGLRIQHQVSQPKGSQAELHTQTSSTSLRNSQQPLGTFPQGRVGYNQVAAPQHKEGLRIQHQVSQLNWSQAEPHAQTSSTLLQNSQQPLGAFPQGRVGLNQIATPQRTKAVSLQHQVAQPEASQAHLHAHPNSASVQQNNVNRMIRQQSDQTPSSTRTSNTDNDLGTRLLENALERRARSHVEALSLYNEVQLVYNELQKSLNEGTYRQKQTTTAQTPRSLDHQLNQLPTSKNTPPSNKQPPDAASSTNSLSSVSKQSAVYCHTPANQLTSQVSSSQSLSEGTDKRSVHFSQEADSNVPVNVSAGNVNGSIRLGSSAVRQTDDKNQNSPSQDISYRFSIDKDPYKVPPKTPSGALEDVVKKLLALQNEIARTENVSGDGPVSSNSLAESTNGTSKAANTTESQESKQTLGISESAASSERDSNSESLQHYSRNPEHNSAETISLNQGTDIQGLIKDQHKNNGCSSGNYDKPTEDTSVSPSSDNVLDADCDKMQTENETPSSVLEGNDNANEREIEHFPATEGEEQDSAYGDGQDNRVSDGQDSPATCSSGLTKETENKDKQDTNDAENDNSSQDIYVHLMSPIIPRIAAARRVRSYSDGDVDKSTSSIDASIQNVNSDDHNMEYDSEPKQSTDDREQVLNDSQQEGASLCGTVPSADVDCNQQEHGCDTASNSERSVNDQEHVPLSSDVTMKEMQLEEDIQVSSTSAIVTALNDAQQAACNTKIQEMPRAHLSEDQLSTELRDGQGDLPVPVPNSNVKLEASNGSCMDGVAQVHNKMEEDEQHQKCQLNPGAIPKQDFVCLNSTFQETPIVGDIEETKKASLTWPLPSSLFKKNVDEKSVGRIPVESKKNVESKNTNTAINNELSQQPLNTSPLPTPRLAVRIMNGNTVIMWDLPPDNKNTNINFFEVYVFLINKDGRAWRNQAGQWIKVGQMKAMPLPMACTIRQVIQKNVLYFFIVRAVGHNGLPGPFSKPCCVACS